MLRDPQPGTAAETEPAEIAGLEPACAATLGVLWSAVGHQTLDRHREERHGEVREQHHGGEQWQRARFGGDGPLA